MVLAAGGVVWTRVREHAHTPGATPRHKVSQGKPQVCCAVHFLLVFWGKKHVQFYCFTSRKVKILTQKAAQSLTVRAVLTVYVYESVYMRAC